MNEQKFDRLFRERLGSHSESPPAGLWAGIEAQALNKDKPKSGMPWRIIGATVLVASLLGLGSISQPGNDADQALSLNEQPREQIVQTELSTPPPFGYIETNTTPSATNTSTGDAVVPELPYTGDIITYPYSAPGNPQDDPSISSSGSPTTVDFSNYEPSTTQNKGIPEPPTEVIPNDEIPIEYISEAVIVKAESPETESPQLGSADFPVTGGDPNPPPEGLGEKKQKEVKKPRPQFYPYLGSSYIAERLIPVDGPETGLWNQHLGIHFGVQYNNWLIETGIYSSQNHDSWAYNVDYLSNDSVDWYWDVVSVAFIPLLNQFGDTVGWEPQYQAIQSPIYDSVAHSHSETLEMKYSYLHIPLYIGFRRPITKGLSYTVKAGYIFSRAIEISEPGPQFNSSLVSITDINDGRFLRNHNINQFSLSTELAYRLNEHWSIAVEPQARFYRGAYFRKPDASLIAKPYSLGVRTGLTYHF